MDILEQGCQVVMLRKVLISEVNLTMDDDCSEVASIVCLGFPEIPAADGQLSR